MRNPDCCPANVNIVLSHIEAQTHEYLIVCADREIGDLLLCLGHFRLSYLCSIRIYGMSHLHAGYEVSLRRPRRNRDRYLFCWNVDDNLSTLSRTLSRIDAAENLEKRQNTVYT